MAMAMVGKVKLPEPSLCPDLESQTLDTLRAQYVNTFTNSGTALRSAATLQSAARGWLARARQRVQEKSEVPKKKKAKTELPKPGNRRRRKPDEEETRKLLLQRLQNLGLQLLPCSDDGNCQFRAISRCLYGTQAHHLRLRRAAVNFMRANREQYEPFLLPEDGGWDDFLEDMCDSGTWGGQKTLMALTNVLGIKIHILNGDSGHEWIYSSFEPHADYKGPVRNVFLAYEAPVHYDALLVKTGGKARGVAPGKREPKAQESPKAPPKAKSTPKAKASPKPEAKGKRKAAESEAKAPAAKKPRTQKKK
eukprot:Hpha_TRINITY_DN8198_c0_g1::TRINITY_DN8198_c0_g1_i1::g.171885::m.171885